MPGVPDGAGLVCLLLAVEFFAVGLGTGVFAAVLFPGITDVIFAVCGVTDGVAAGNTIVVLLLAEEFVDRFAFEFAAGAHEMPKTIKQTVKNKRNLFNIINTYTI